VLLDALANPGTVRPGIVHPRLDTESVPVNPWLTSVLLTLLDHEVSLHVAPGPGAVALSDFMVRRARTTLTDAGSATFVAAQATSLEHDLPEQLRRGTLEYPDDGATLLVDVRSLDQGVTGDLELSLTGPGIRTVQRLRLSGIGSRFFHSRNRANAHYPMGIDIVLIDGIGRVVGLPRTTELTIYAEGAR
jgi:alpha-D-ribose 1-methylphosphonate 5-triphosphate synthase subunit PhnH